jgi:polar amino acid transport system substrate-binding protein
LKRLPRLLFGLIALSLFAVPTRAADPLRWGGDKTGGAPYLFEDDGKFVGFEVELAAFIAAELGRTPEFVNGRWDDLPDALKNKRVDIVLNGYEYSKKRHEETPTSLPYFVYCLRLIGRRDDNTIRSWDDLRGKDGKPGKQVAVLRGSASQEYMRERFGDSLRLEPSEEVDSMLRLVEEGGRMDASVQDSPTTAYYVQEKRIERLHVIDKPAAYGLYVILTRPEDADLRERINTALRKALKTGKLKEIYSRYGLWNADQQRLDYFHARDWPPDETDLLGDEDDKGVQTFSHLTLGMIAGNIAWATWLTVALAFCSMPLAIALGILIAVGRMYGPWPLRTVLTAFVEIIRGTPLILQMFIWFYLVPQLAQWSGVSILQWLTALPPFVYGVYGLALNYSAYEAENYRAGLQAIPRGQMEAALALGMTTGTAVRRIILPQAIRIVIPPVANDFIAMLKDTSICSMILITELTGLYYQFKYHREIVLELALTVGLIYLLLSYPLSLLARWLEARLRRSPD